MRLPAAAWQAAGGKAKGRRAKRVKRVGVGPRALINADACSNQLDVQEHTARVWSRPCAGRHARLWRDERKPSARFLSIATGGTGGVYYPYGGGIAKVLNEKLPSVRATAEVTAATVDNLKLIRDGRADIAFALADTLEDAIEGRGPFEGRPVPAVSLAVLYANYTHVVALASSNIRTVADLRGKVVSTGSPGSGTEVIALRVLAAAGLDPVARSDASGPGRVGVRRRAEGRQDRRVLLERRPADRRDPGSVAHARQSRSGSCRTATCCPRSSAITAISTFR